MLIPTASSQWLQGSDGSGFCWLSPCHLPHDRGFTSHPGPIMLLYLSSWLDSELSSPVLSAPGSCLKSWGSGPNLALQVSLTLDICLPGAPSLSCPRAPCHLTLHTCQGTSRYAPCSFTGTSGPACPPWSTGLCLTTVPLYLLELYPWNLSRFLLRRSQRPLQAPPRTRAYSLWIPGNGQQRRSCWDKRPAAWTAPHHSSPRGCWRRAPSLGSVFQEDSLSHCGNATLDHTFLHLLFLLPAIFRREIRNLSFAL